MEDFEVGWLGEVVLWVALRGWGWEWLWGVGLFVPGRYPAEGFASGLYAAVGLWSAFALDVLLPRCLLLGSREALRSRLLVVDLV